MRATQRRRSCATQVSARSSLRTILLLRPTQRRRSRTMHRRRGRTTHVLLKLLLHRLHTMCPPPILPEMLPVFALLPAAAAAAPAPAHAAAAPAKAAAKADATATYLFSGKLSRRVVVFSLGIVSPHSW